MVAERAVATRTKKLHTNVGSYWTYGFCAGNKNTHPVYQLCSSVMTIFFVVACVSASYLGCMCPLTVEFQKILFHPVLHRCKDYMLLAGQQVSHVDLLSMTLGLMMK